MAGAANRTSFCSISCTLLPVFCRRIQEAGEWARFVHCRFSPGRTPKRLSIGRAAGESRRAGTTYPPRTRPATRQRPSTSELLKSTKATQTVAPLGATDEAVTAATKAKRPGGFRSPGLGGHPLGIWTFTTVLHLGLARTCRAFRGNPNMTPQTRAWRRRPRLGLRQSSAHTGGRGPHAQRSC
jgi:hypothetical protein